MTPRPRRRRVLAPMTRCRLARTAIGMSQLRLAQLAGVPQPYVSRIELRNLDDYPDVLAAVAKVLGMKPEQLMEEVS